MPNTGSTSRSPSNICCFIKNLLHGEFGQSIIYRAPVLGVVADRIAPTLFLLIYAVILAVLMAVLLGSLAAARRGRPTDQAIRLFSTIGLGLPAFWLGIVLIMFFSIRLGWFPVSGYGDDFLDRLHHLFLPAFTVALATAPILTRNLRASLIAESQADYVSAARAKGLPRHVIFFHHIFRNSLIPTINLLGVNVGWLIGGTVVVESVFSVPGLGSLLVSSIFARDYLVVQAITLILAPGRSSPRISPSTSSRSPSTRGSSHERWRAPPRPPCIAVWARPRCWPMSAGRSASSGWWWRWPHPGWRPTTRSPRI